MRMVFLEPEQYEFLRQSLKNARGQPRALDEFHIETIELAVEAAVDLDEDKWCEHKKMLGLAGLLS